MIIKYKLTTQGIKTREGEVNETRWEVGKWVEATGDIKRGLCSEAYVHWYAHPLLAVLLNPIHAGIENPRLWEVETDGDSATDGQLKGGSRRVRLTKEIPVPNITLEQCVRFAILCAKRVCVDKQWNKWANGWLSGANRTADAAGAAAYATEAADSAGRPLDLVVLAEQAMNIGA